MRKVLRQAFIATLPVMTGYLVLGIGFGLTLYDRGGNVLLALAMSGFIYAGSMQYLAVDLFSTGATLLSAAMVTLMVNARHLFYGVSMLEKYRGMGAAKPYLIFGLTDETYSLLCQDALPVPEGQRKAYYLLVTLLDHLWWVLGTLLGAGAAALMQINTTGMDFALTALFVTVLVEQWLTAKDRVPALIGGGASLVCLLLFGAEDFLIPAMLIIALMLCLYTGKRRGGAGHE